MCARVRACVCMCHLQSLFICSSTHLDVVMLYILEIFNRDGSPWSPDSDITMVSGQNSE